MAKKKINPTTKMQFYNGWIGLRFLFCMIVLIFVEHVPVPVLFINNKKIPVPVPYRKKKINLKVEIRKFK